MKMTMTMTRNQRTRNQTRMNRGTKNQKTKNRVDQNRNQMSDQKIEPTDETAVGALRSQCK